MHRAGAFLRAITTQDVERLDERQMVLPHVPMDAAPETPPPAQAPMAPSSVTEVEKTIWGSPAGKKRLAARLVKLIPPHKTYVEPFAGSAAVFFEKLCHTSCAWPV